LALLNIQQEKELLSQLAEGSKPAFENIYNHYFSPVFYFARRYLPDTQAAEDITSETFLKCWEKRGDFENLRKLQSFLYTTTRNACINSLRSEKRQADREKQLDYLLSQTSEEGQEGRDLTARIYQYIYEEIEKLPAQEKTIFKMAYIDGLSNEEIAEKMGINNQSVRNYKSRALKTMRLALADKDIYKMLLIFILCRN
jgi:RNA polymerase sigma-70 factor (ECF subfamily)